MKLSVSKTRGKKGKKMIVLEKFVPCLNRDVLKAYPNSLILGFIF